MQFFTRNYDVGGPLYYGGGGTIDDEVPKPVNDQQETRPSALKQELRPYGGALQSPGREEIIDAAARGVLEAMSGERKFRDTKEDGADHPENPPSGIIN